MSRADRRIRFTVRGPGTFPHDMLRYDRVEVENEDDLRKVEESGPASGTYEVTLVTTDPRPPSWRPTVGRWNSFLWGVVDGSREVVR